MHRSRLAPSCLVLFVLLLLTSTFAGCSGDSQPTPTTTASPPVPYLLAGPHQQDFDPNLEQKATRYDRQNLVLNSDGDGNSSDVVIPTTAPADRQLVEDFLRTTDGWDFEAWSGKPVFSVVTDFQGVNGLYAGVGIAADAYRYGTLRDQGYPREEVDRAREFLVRSIQGIFVAVEITGVEGVIARSWSRTDIPTGTSTHETTPLFDEQGNPLPPEKTNGTLRADNSPDHRFSNIVWVDSCSRDYFIGWAAAFGGVWEVIKDDPTFDAEVKQKLQTYASQLGRSLMVERTGGPASLGQAFDLEIFDADGRTTFHGYLNENNFDRIYLAWLPIKNGMYSLMALGIVAALTYCSEDPVLEDYLYEQLIGVRGLDKIAVDNQIGVNLWIQTNYSATNMAFEGALLAMRYIRDPAVREKIQVLTETLLYQNNPERLLFMQPEEYAYSLFDFTYAASVTGSSAFSLMAAEPDAGAMQRGIQTLYDFREPPYWEEGVTNCDQQEIDSGDCVLNDGTRVKVLGNVGRNQDLITDKPIPQAVRPPSNYHWRSNPYCPNGGGEGDRMVAGVDFRYAYWYARWVH
jgi:hypothetical protein